MTDILPATNSTTNLTPESFAKLASSRLLIDRKSAVSVQYNVTRKLLGPDLAAKQYEAFATDHWIIQTGAAKQLKDAMNDLTPGRAVDFFESFAKGNLLLRETAQEQFHSVMEKFDAEHREMACGRLEQVVGFRRLVANYRIGVFTPYKDLPRLKGCPAALTVSH